VKTISISAIFDRQTSLDFVDLFTLDFLNFCFKSVCYYLKCYLMFVTFRFNIYNITFERFVGHSLDECMSYLFETSNDVLLREKSTVLFQRIFSIILRFEKQNKIIEKFSLYFGKIIEMLTSFFKR
jgi:hypothetical protein